MSITAHHIFFIRYQPKALFFLPNVQFHFAWGLKLKILRNFFIICFRTNKRKWKHPFSTKQSHFLGGAKRPHYFRGSPILILLAERFWDIKDVAHDLSFVKVLFFPIQVLNVSFWKGLFLGNDFEVLNQSPKRFQTKIVEKYYCRNFSIFFFGKGKQHDWSFFETDHPKVEGEKIF